MSSDAKGPPTPTTVAIRPDLSVTLTESGKGRTVLVLHGGGGPFTVASISAHLLSKSMHVITPTHPGWLGTPRPASLARPGDIATAYVEYLTAQKLHDVLVIGSSLGGWIASEMAIKDKAGLITGIVLLDAVGVLVPSEPIVDFFALDPKGVAEHSYHDPAKYGVDPTKMPPERLAAIKANMVTMRSLVADPYMHDPTLLARLGEVKAPALVIWGASDRIVTPAYGKAFAAGFPHSRFEIVKEAGHLPQIEQPAATFALLDGFIANKH